MDRKVKEVSLKAEKPGNPAIIQVVSLSWLLIPAVILFKMLSMYADNIPVKDDYPAILGYLIDYKHAHDVSEKIRLTMSQYNEHRIATSRFIYLIWYKLTGTISFEALLYIGNLMLVPIFLICAAFIRNFVTSYWYIPAFIMSMCIFDPASYENNYMAMACIANFGIIMWFMLSLYLYNKDSARLMWIGALCQVLCIYSNGNGMIGAFVIALATVFSRDKRKMIVAASIFIIFSALYFVGYTHPANQVTGSTIQQMIPFYLHTVGGHFGYEYGIWGGALVLILLIVFLPVSKGLKIKRDAIPLLAILAFALISLAVVAIFRSGVKELDSYSSRYFIYNKLITAITFCFIFQKLIGKKAFWPFVVIVGLSLLVRYRYDLAWGEGAFRLEKRRRVSRFVYFDEKSKKIAEKACAEGIYCIDDFQEDATPFDYY